MYIVFPNCLVYLERDDEDGQRQAQAIGQTFDIPVSQMRFLEMFEVDHPDAPAQDVWNRKLLAKRFLDLDDAEADVVMAEMTRLFPG